MQNCQNRLNCGEAGPSGSEIDGLEQILLTVAGATRRRHRSAEELAGVSSDRRFRARFAVRDVREAPGKNGELTRVGQDSRAGLVRAGDEEQRVVDGELRRVGVLVVGGEVGDFGEQQGDKGSLLTALDRSGKPWFALASTISGLRLRCSSVVAKTMNLVGFLG